MATGGKKACGAIALLVVVPAVFAQSARQDASGVRFDVSGYAVEGRVLPKSEDFTRIVAPFIGRHKSTADVAQARSTLQQAYHDLGYCLTRVALSQPMPQDGVVVFRVTEEISGGPWNCLPLVALEEPGKPGPSVSPGARTPQSPVIPQASTRFGASPHGAAPAMGVIAFPYIESRGNTGLMLTMDDAGPA